MSKTYQFDRYRPHPWHGLEVGVNPPGLVNVYVEITPFDRIKYELDPATGFLRVDRPQRNATLPPALYGLVPRTLCGDQVASFCEGVEHGDGDALDICVLSEHQIHHPEVLLSAQVVGGIRTIDAGTADEKIIAVLENDLAWGAASDVGDLPAFLLERLRQYFASYKREPGQPNPIELRQTYGADEARQVVGAAIEDYRAVFGE